MSLNSIRGAQLTPTRLFDTPVPITLHPVAFPSSLVYGQDGNLYTSDAITWTLATSTQGIQGIQGSQGVQGNFGPSLVVIGTIATVGGSPQTALNTAFPGASVGEGVIDEATQDFWVYNGANWVNAGPIAGVQGVQGIQGVQGTQGTQGRQGIQGIQGTVGQGVQGIQGIQGRQGVQGIQGTAIQGIQGMQGMGKERFDKNHILTNGKSQLYSRCLVNHETFFSFVVRLTNRWTK